MERLVALCARFPLWMRPDVVRGIEHTLGVDATFLGARTRGSDQEFLIRLLGAERFGFLAAPV